MSIAETNTLKALHLCKRAFVEISEDPIAKDADFLSSFGETFSQKLSDKTTKVTGLWKESEGYLDGVLKIDPVSKDSNVSCQVVMDQEVFVETLTGTKKETIDLIIIKKEPEETFHKFELNVKQSTYGNKATIYPIGREITQTTYRIGKWNKTKKKSKFNAYVRYLIPGAGPKPAIIMCYGPCNEELATFNKNDGFETLTSTINESLAQNVSEEETDKVDKGGETEVTQTPKTIIEILESELSDEFIEQFKRLFFDDISEILSKQILSEPDLQVIEMLKPLFFNLKGTGNEPEGKQSSTEILEERIKTILQKTKSILDKRKQEKSELVEKLVKTEEEVKKWKEKYFADLLISTKKEIIAKTLRLENKEETDKLNTEIGNFKNRNYNNPIKKLFTFRYFYEGELQVEQSSFVVEFKPSCMVLDGTKAFNANLKVNGLNEACITFKHDIYDEKSREVKTSEKNGGKVFVDFHLQKKQAQYISSINLFSDKDIDGGCGIEIAFGSDKEETKYQSLYRVVVDNMSDKKRVGLKEEEVSSNFSKTKLKWSENKLFIRSSEGSACRFEYSGPFNLSDLSNLDEQIQIDREGNLSIRHLGIYEDKPVLNIFLASHVGIINESNTSESTHEAYPFHP